MDFSPEQKYNLLTAMGYSGSSHAPEMDAFVQSNPRAAALMGKFNRVVQKRTGMATGGTAVTPPPAATGETFPAVSVYGPDGKMYSSPQQAIDAGVTNYTMTPPAPTTPKSAGTILTEQVIKDPSKLTTTAAVDKIAVTPDTLIASTVGQAGAVGETETSTVDSVAKAEAPVEKAAAKVTAETAAPAVSKLVEGVKAVEGTIKPQDLVVAAQETKSSLEGMKSAQGEGILMNNPVQREVQAEELVSGSAVDATKVKALTESIQAAEATPTKQATVAGQLEGLMKNFEGGATPAWAAGAMRNAQAMLAQRGLGASSMAGQAVIQAAMESALPIAQADASTRAQFESQNLTNRQQVAVLAAQQRATFLGQEFDQAFQTRVTNAAKVSDIANMNFTAEQNIALENSRIVNTVNLANLNNKQGMVLAQAAALSNLDIANLNNRQQAAVQNAQNFLQMDLQNLDNEQQTVVFKAQANVNALLTDTAAKNVAAQFNAKEENQVNQFYDGLVARASEVNALAINTMNEFNAGQKNAAAKLDAELKAQREEFNAKNSLEIAQANAVWRQNVTTLDTAAQNDANTAAALAMNNLTEKGMDEILQRERDIMDYAFTSQESAADRANALLITDKNISAADRKLASDESTARSAFFVKLVGDWG